VFAGSEATAFFFFFFLPGGVVQPESCLETCRRGEEEGRKTVLNISRWACKQ
jgi:hypothetical protein